jgi:uncharacterized protein (DUF4415 family)
MDGETRKDTRQTVQDKDNAPSNNQPKVTKNGRPEEANFVKKQVSLRIEHVDLALAVKLPSNQCPQI